MNTSIQIRKDIRIHVNLEKIHNSYYPNFQAEYMGNYSRIAIDLSMIEGLLPAEIMVLIFDWARQNFDKLDEKWMGLINERKMEKTLKKVN